MGVLVITHWCVGYLAQQLSEPSPETHSFDERTQCDKTYLSMPINHSNVHHAVKVLVNVWTPHQSINNHGNDYTYFKFFKLCDQFQLSNIE